MLQYLYILLVVIAVGTTYYALFNPENEVSLIFGFISTFLWIVIAFASLQVDIYSRSAGEFVTYSEPSLALLSIMVVLLCVVNNLVILREWFSEYRSM